MPYIIQDDYDINVQHTSKQWRWEKKYNDKVVPIYKLENNTRSMTSQHNSLISKVELDLWYTKTSKNQAQNTSWQQCLFCDFLN